MLPQLIDPEQRLLSARRHADELRAEWRIANTGRSRRSRAGAVGNLSQTTGHALIGLGRRLLAAASHPLRSTVPAARPGSGC